MSDSATSRATPLRPLLAPQSIAVVGASHRAGTIGNQIVRNLISYGYTGAVYPVNPRAASVCAVPTWRSMQDVPGPVDVAIVAVPRDHVLEVADGCGRAGTRGLVVVSAGFREVGPDGAALEHELHEIVRRYGMRMVGPNCMGIINADPRISMNGTFCTVMPAFGASAFVSQSGALGLGVLDYAREYGIGISQFVSVGNKADVSSNDLLLEWEHDETVRVILMYVENFGNPRRFLEIASRLTRTKPIIAVKSGRSRAGARAATSHTGALAASDTAVDALLAQAGVLRASTIEELFDMAIAFESRVLPRSRRTAVLTNAGGPGILAADAMETCGLDLVELGAETVEQLRPLFPAAASIRNPLDMISSATPAGYRAAMSVLLADPAIDTVVPIFVPPFGIRQEDVAGAIVGAAERSPEKAVFAVLMGREGLPAGRAELHDAGIPAYIFPESAARAIAALNRHVDQARAAAPDLTPPADIDRDAARAILDGAVREGREQLTQIEALDLLAAYGVPVARARLARDADDVVRLARDVGYPVALKLVSPDVIHKSDVGAVHVGLASDDAAHAAYDEMLARVRAALPGARIDGVLVQPMIPAGTELIVGITRDPAFGALVMVGLGGIFVEAMGDVMFRVAPVDERQALEMLGALRGARILDGLRGRGASDRAAIASVVRRVSHLAADWPEIAELDVNPLMTRADVVCAVDARVRIARGASRTGNQASTDGACEKVTYR
ncbi:MAG TPA: acetate--CoA ligase family protein [Gemmatimonadaceae bacterium]|nr:acetate--CoA ligase family protein [Gemmatimonadaceae bacterium]